MGILSILSYAAAPNHADTAVVTTEVFSSGVNPLIVCSVVVFTLVVDHLLASSSPVFLSLQRRASSCALVISVHILLTFSSATFANVHTHTPLNHPVLFGIGMIGTCVSIVNAFFHKLNHPIGVSLNTASIVAIRSSQMIAIPNRLINTHPNISL